MFEKYINEWSSLNTLMRLKINRLSKTINLKPMLVTVLMKNKKKAKKKNMKKQRKLSLMKKKYYWPSTESQS